MRSEPRFYDKPYPFDYLRERILATHPLGRPLRALCAACGTGEALYTVAMVLAEQLADRVGWEVWGADTEAAGLQRAREAIYDLRQAEALPRGYLTRFCLRGVRAKEGLICIAPAVRERVRLQRIDEADEFGGMGEFDVIFCLRALRSEGQGARRRLPAALAAHLRWGGHLVLQWTGVEVDANQIDGEGALRPVAPSVFCKEKEGP